MCSVDEVAVAAKLPPAHCAAQSGDEFVGTVSLPQLHVAPASVHAARRLSLPRRPPPSRHPGPGRGRRPHMSLGSAIPDPPEGLPVELGGSRHVLTRGSVVASRPVLNGLHNDYRLEEIAA